MRATWQPPVTCCWCKAISCLISPAQLFLPALGKPSLGAVRRSQAWRRIRPPARAPVSGYQEPRRRRGHRVDAGTQRPRRDLLERDPGFKRAPAWCASQVERQGTSQSLQIRQGCARHSISSVATSGLAAAAPSTCCARRSVHAAGANSDTFLGNHPVGAGNFLLSCNCPARRTVRRRQICATRYSPHY